jgi:hypothetical protein
MESSKVHFDVCFDGWKIIQKSSRKMLMAKKVVIEKVTVW